MDKSVYEARWVLMPVLFLCVATTALGFIAA